MDHQLISIVLITYRTFDYLYETLDSIFIQDYPAIEIIITDDGSPEFPEENIKAYIENNKKSNIKQFKVLHNIHNVGTVKNINNGINNSNGEYIKIIAGDDVYYDGKVFSKQMEVFKNTDTLIVTGKTCECDSEMNPIYKTQVNNTNKVLDEIFLLEPKDFFRECHKHLLFPLVTQALMIKREFFDKYGLYDERYRLLEDPPMEVRIITNRIPVKVADCTVVKHRASVGISSNVQLISKNQSQYYLDLANYVKNEKLSRPDVFPHFESMMQYKKEMYRYKMSCEESSLQRLLLTLKNIDALLWYIFSNPKRIIERVFRKHKKLKKK